MRALGALGEDGLTGVMIAHRLSSIVGCDDVVELHDGRIIARGSFAEVVGKVEARRD